MGSTIYVEWTDGPLATAVEMVAAPYQGGRFDSSIDLAYTVTSYLLPDGSAMLAQSPGTESNMGADPAFNAFKPSPDAERVKFSVSSISCRRRYSAGLIRRALEKIERQTGAQILAAVEISGSVANGFWPIGIRSRLVAGEYLDDLLRSELLRRSCFVKRAA